MGWRYHPSSRLPPPSGVVQVLLGRGQKIGARSAYPQPARTGQQRLWLCDSNGAQRELPEPGSLAMWPTYPVGYVTRMKPTYQLTRSAMWLESRWYGGQAAFCRPALSALPLNGCFDSVKFSGYMRSCACVRACVVGCGWEKLVFLMMLLMEIEGCARIWEEKCKNTKKG